MLEKTTCALSAAWHQLGGLTRSTLAVFGWNIARLSTQLIWVVMMARTLGVEGYGVFSGAAGLALALSGVVGAGLGLRLYRDVARKPTMLGERWSQAARVLGWTSGALWLVFVAGGLKMFPEIPAGVLACIALSELVGAPMVVHVAFAYAAHGRMSQAAAAPVVLSLARVIAVALLYLLVPDGDIRDYAVIHVATTSVAAALLWWWCRRDLRPPPTSARLDPGALREGAQLSAIWASGIAFGAIDKAVALREGGADLAGQYTAASRFANLVALPVDALITAVMPRLFRAGDGQATHSRLLPMLGVLTLGYGLVAGALLWIGAGSLAWVLGEAFASAVPVLQVLSLFVPAYCLRTLAAHILLGYGWIRWRLASEALALLAMVTMMVSWIPESGAEGAAWAVVVAESVLLVSLWTRVLVGLRKNSVTA